MNIRTKITAVAVAVVLAVAAILITAGYRSQSAAEARYVNEVLSGKRQLWAQIAGRL
jgi:sensor domain CHASE-containing protein